MSSCEIDDQKVISDIQSGNTEQFRLIVDRYAPVVFHIVRRFEKDEIHVKERAHEIFLKIYERLNSYNGDSAFSSWVYMVALNYCRDDYRKEQRRNKRMDEYGEELSDSWFESEDNPEHDMINRETAGLLDAGIKKLKPDYALPLIMKYREGLSYEAISEVLNVSVSALKVRIHRARNELKNILEDKL